MSRQKGLGDHNDPADFTRRRKFLPGAPGKNCRVRKRKRRESEDPRRSFA
jgi:hypothetical protein